MKGYGSSRMSVPESFWDEPPKTVEVLTKEKRKLKASIELEEKRNQKLKRRNKKLKKSIDRFDEKRTELEKNLEQLYFQNDIAQNLNKDIENEKTILEQKAVALVDENKKKLNKDQSEAVAANKAEMISHENKLTNLDAKIAANEKYFERQQPLINKIQELESDDNKVMKVINETLKNQENVKNAKEEKENSDRKAEFMKRKWSNLWYLPYAWVLKPIFKTIKNKMKTQFLLGFAVGSIGFSAIAYPSAYVALFTVAGAFWPITLIVVLFVGIFGIIIYNKLTNRKGVKS